MLCIFPFFPPKNHNIYVNNVLRFGAFRNNFGYNFTCITKKTPPDDFAPEGVFLFYFSNTGITSRMLLDISVSAPMASISSACCAVSAKQMLTTIPFSWA